MNLLTNFDLRALMVQTMEKKA